MHFCARVHSLSLNCFMWGYSRYIECVNFILLILFELKWKKIMKIVAFLFFQYPNPNFRLVGDLTCHQLPKFVSNTFGHQHLVNKPRCNPFLNHLLAFLMPVQFFFFGPSSLLFVDPSFWPSWVMTVQFPSFRPFSLFLSVVWTVQFNPQTTFEIGIWSEFCSQKWHWVIHPKCIFFSKSSKIA